MKVVILGAMEEEIVLLKASLQNLTIHQVQHLEVYVGNLHSKQIILARCGIGKVAAAVATTILLTAYNPDFVINTGSAGGFHQDLSIGDIVIASELKHADADLTHFGYEFGQCAGMPESFLCEPALISAATQASLKLGKTKTITGLVCSGDSFIGTDEAAAKIRSLFPDICAVEMEGAAIAQACYLLKVGCLVIRSLSDIAGKTSTVSFETYLEQAAKHSAELVMATIAELTPQPKL